MKKEFSCLMTNRWKSAWVIAKKWKHFEPWATVLKARNTHRVSKLSGRTERDKKMRKSAFGATVTFVEENIIKNEEVHRISNISNHYLTWLIEFGLSEQEVESKAFRKHHIRFTRQVDCTFRRSANLSEASKAICW